MDNYIHLIWAIIWAVELFCIGMGFVHPVCLIIAAVIASVLVIIFVVEFIRNAYINRKK